MVVSVGALPFDEAVAFFRRKVNVPTGRWQDLWQEQHDLGFMVAGVAKAELLADLRGAVDAAIAEGVSQAAFTKDFAAIAQRHGWAPQQGVAWRAKTVYTTNLRTAYAAGRYEQLTHPDTLAERPFWEYRHGDSRNPRLEHKAWDGLILPASDPWWKYHYPPCGWGCSCHVAALSADDLADMGAKVGKAPPIRMLPYVDPASGLRTQVPAGVDPGWGYAPGRLAAERGEGPSAGDRHPIWPWVEAKTRALPADLGAELWREWREDTPRLVDAASIDFANWVDQVASTGRTVGERRLVGVLTPRTVAFVQAKLAELGKPGLSSAAIEVRDADVAHALRDNKQASDKAIPPDLMRQLPRALAGARRVLWDAQKAGLVFELDVFTEDGRAAKSAVRLNFMRKERGEEIVVNLLRTSGLVPRQALRNPGAYERIEGGPEAAP